MKILKNRARIADEFEIEVGGKYGNMEICEK